jgi:hypothetical protein
MPLRVIANIPAKPSDAQMARFRQKMQKNAAAAMGAPLLGVLPSAKEGTETKRERASARLTPEETADLIKYCKDRGWTVTHAISAAVALALKHTQRTNGETRDMRFYLQSMMSTRYLCGSRGSSVQEAASNNHMISIQGLGVDVTVGAEETSDSFDKIASKMKEYYQSGRPSCTDGPDVSDLGIAHLLWSAITPQSAPGTASADSHTANAGVGISSLGNISSMVQLGREPFTLRDVWVTGECVGAAIPLMVGGWGGKLEIATIFDKAYHEREPVESLLSHVLSILQKQTYVQRAE